MPGKNVAVKQKNGSQRPIVSRCTQHFIPPVFAAGTGYGLVPDNA
jgi:hypothetical protein